MINPFIEPLLKVNKYGCTYVKIGTQLIDVIDDTWKDCVFTIIGYTSQDVSASLIAFKTAEELLKGLKEVTQDVDSLDEILYIIYNCHYPNGTTRLLQDSITGTLRDMSPKLLGDTAISSLLEE